MCYCALPNPTTRLWFAAFAGSVTERTPSPRVILELCILAEASTTTLEPLVCMVACTSKCCLPDSPGFDTEFVVDCYSQTLPAANIAFGGLNRDMPEKKLNLLELASRIVAEPRA